MASKAGDETSASSADPISFSPKSSSPFLWTAVSGTVAQNTQLNQQPTEVFGGKSSLETSRGTGW
jgi:hypothetical protein